MLYLGSEVGPGREWDVIRDASSLPAIFNDVFDGNNQLNIYELFSACSLTLHQRFMPSTNA